MILAQMAKVVAGGGCFLIEWLNADYLVSQSWFCKSQELRLSFHSPFRIGANVKDKSELFAICWIAATKTELSFSFWVQSNQRSQTCSEIESDWFSLGGTCTNTTIDTRQSRWTATLRPLIAFLKKPVVRKYSWGNWLLRRIWAYHLPSTLTFSTVYSETLHLLAGGILIAPPLWTSW